MAPKTTHQRELCRCPSLTGGQFEVDLWCWMLPCDSGTFFPGSVPVHLYCYCYRLCNDPDLYLGFVLDYAPAFWFICLVPIVLSWFWLLACFRLCSLLSSGLLFSAWLCSDEPCFHSWPLLYCSALPLPIWGSPCSKAHTSNPLNSIPLFSVRQLYCRPCGLKDPHFVTWLTVGHICHNHNTAMKIAKPLWSHEIPRTWHKMVAELLPACRAEGNYSASGKKRAVVEKLEGKHTFNKSTKVHPLLFRFFFLLEYPFNTVFINIRVKSVTAASFLFVTSIFHKKILTAFSCIECIFWVYTRLANF